MADNRSEQKVVTWLQLGLSFGGLLIVVIAMWVDTQSKISAQGQAMLDYMDGQKQILQSIQELRTIQMQQVQSIGELKGQLQAFQTITQTRDEAHYK